MDLLEREGALGALGRHMDGAAAGEGCLVFIGGEAGVGKTALVQRFADARRGQARILAGSCDAMVTPRPLGPLMDMAPDLGDEVVQLMHEDGKRSATFAAFLEDITDGSDPTVVTIEDVHWADGSTLDLLRYLGRRIVGARCLALATYRDDEVGPRHRLKTVMGDLATSPNVHRLSLEPLSTEAVAELAGSEIDAEDLHRRTGGNPFYVTEILRAAEPGIPGTLRDTILARVARLSPEAQAALETAAVIGSRAETRLLLAAAGVGADAVDECLAAGLLQTEPGALSFRHELARDAVLEAIPSAHAVEIHARVLAELRGGKVRVDLARLVQHAEGAQDAAAVLEFAPAAAVEAASLRAHREAAAHYGRALRFGGLIPEQRAKYLEAQSYELQLCDELDQAITAREEARDIRRSLGDDLKMGDDIRRLCWLYRFSGHRDEADVAGQQAVDVLEALPAGPELAWAYSNEAHLRMLDADIGGAIDWGMRAVELGNRFADTAVVAHALNNIGSAKLSGGIDSGRDDLLESLRLAQAVDAEESVGRAYANLVAPSAWNWRFGELDQFIPEGVAYCTEHGLDGIGLYIQAIDSFLQLGHGDWDEAKKRALRVITRINVAPASKMVALTVLGRARARRGDPDVFVPLDEAQSLAIPSRELLRIGPVATARAESRLLAGDIEAAAAEAEAAIDLAAELHHVGLHCELAYWRWRCGRDQPVPDAGPDGFRLEMQGRFAEAAAAWSNLGCPYEAAQALSQSDDPEDVRQALLEFDRLGARPAAAATARRMRERGIKGMPRGARPATRANPAGLTNREVEVLELLAEDMRNAEIAARLHLSAKTVDHHVSSILAKLGVRGRAEAARAARDLAEGN